MFLKNKPSLNYTQNLKTKKCTTLADVQVHVLLLSIAHEVKNYYTCYACRVWKLQHIAITQLYSKYSRQKDKVAVMPK
jgi:hypothetical protein